MPKEKELATLILSVPSNRIEQLKAVVKDKLRVASINTHDFADRKWSHQAEYWRKEEAFWKSIWEQLQ